MKYYLEVVLELTLILYQLELSMVEKFVCHHLSLG